MDTSAFLADTPPATGPPARGQPHGADPQPALGAEGSVTPRLRGNARPAGGRGFLIDRLPRRSLTSSTSHPGHNPPYVLPGGMWPCQPPPAPTASCPRSAVPYTRRT